MKMKQKFAAMLPCLIVLGVDFYLLPLLLRDTGTAMVLMLCVMPLAALAAGAAYGARHGFSLLPAAAAAVLFTPSVLLFYNSTAWPYAAFYAAAVLAGTGLGRMFRKERL